MQDDYEYFTQAERESSAATEFEGDIEAVKSERRGDHSTRLASEHKPVHEIRLGRIKASIWVNSTEYGARYNVTFSRLYKGADGKWRVSDSFGREDLLLICKVADTAHSWTFQQENV